MRARSTHVGWVAKRRRRKATKGFLSRRAAGIWLVDVQMSSMQSQVRCMLLPQGGRTTQRRLVLDLQRGRLACCLVHDGESLADGDSIKNSKAKDAGRGEREEERRKEETRQVQTVGRGHLFYRYMHQLAFCHGRYSGTDRRVDEEIFPWTTLFRSVIRMGKWANCGTGKPAQTVLTRQLLCCSAAARWARQRGESSTGCWPDHLIRLKLPHRNGAQRPPPPHTVRRGQRAREKIMLQN